MGSRAAGPGTPVTDQQRIRYQAGRNISRYDCPPYGVMSRVYLNGSGGENIDGVWTMYLDRPNSTIESRQSAADLVFAGPEGIQAGKPGRFTEDFPCRGLHARSDTLHQRPYIYVDDQGILDNVSIYCGPKADSFLLWDSGFAFRWLHRDEAAILTSDFETGIIVPTPPPWIGATFEIATGSGNVAPHVAVNASIGEVSPSSITDPTWVKVVQSRDAYTDDLVAGSYGDYNGIKINTGGIYQWHFHCSLYSAVAPQGASLIINSYINDGEQNLIQYVYRVNQIEIDNYGNQLNYSIENVAMSGQTFFQAGDVLNFRNGSAYEFGVAAVFCTLRRVGP